PPCPILWSELHQSASTRRWWAGSPPPRIGNRSELRLVSSQNGFYREPTTQLGFETARLYVKSRIATKARMRHLPQQSSTLAPLQYGSFRRLWSATLASNLGGLIQAVGAGWMMTTLPDSRSMVALVQGATTF